MKKLKWNRKLSILVLIMFITVTFASFNTNLFIDGSAYVRVDRDIRVTNIHLLETEYNGYENTGSEYTNHSISTDVSLPRQASSVTYEVTITNVSDRRYKITDIIEDSYDNKDVKYELIDASIGNIIEPHTTKTFRVKFTNNVTIVEEDDVYQTLTYTFDYTGGEQEFVVPYDGTYTLEVWGASGGGSTTIENSFGYGGYSKGTIHLQKNKTLFINVGGQGIQKCDADYGYRKVFKGGYNGGGDGCTWVDNKCEGSGGGATHISYLSGTLNKLSKHKGTLVDNKYYSSQAILIVAGGGGGQGNNGYNGRAGSGGGYKGVDATGGEYWWAGGGGTQTAGGVENTLSLSKNSGFGQGSSAVNGGGNVSGGGGGFFGGGTGSGSGGYGGGGSGYIANPNLTEKVMYCFNCLESDEIQLKTISTNQHSSTPEVNKAKEGNGYAKITITRKIEDGTDIDFDYTGDQQTFTAPYTGIYRLETWGAQGGGIVTDDRNIPGGYGGYSRGSIKLNKNDALNIVVGGAGSSGNKIDLVGGYNGGGSATASVGNAIDASGGGATHIATVTGLLSALSEQKSKVLIVSGGGGGTHYHGNGISYPGSGGGYIGGSSENIYQKNTEYCAPGTGGTQTTGGNNGQGYTNFGTASTFGQGANYTGTYGAGGGGGWYGGGAGLNGNACAYSGNGGSGYIGNSKLSDKIMYCYNCQEIQDTNKKTVTTQSHSKRAKQNTAKEGNGYSRITLVKRTINQTKLTLDFTFEEYVNGNEYTFGYTGAPQTFTVPKTGYYQIELWGASGNNHKNEYVEGHQVYAGYTSGKIKLNKGEQLYVYVGGEAKRFNSNTSSTGASSGGATDIRLKSTTNWYDLDSLSSRIMVAGGAGQMYSDSSAIAAGSAGGLTAYTVSGNHQVVSPTQTTAGQGSNFSGANQFQYTGGNGSFGVGGTSKNQRTEEGLVTGNNYSCGAGGYYGGGGAPSGGSGNSFISGHNGCVAITAESDTTPRNDSNGNQCTNGTTDVTCSKHYSNYVFTDTRMIDGKGYEWTTQVGAESVGMPTHDGTSTMTGNDGDGFAKITCLEEITDYNFEYTGAPQEFVVPYNGVYKVELWGAAGGGSLQSRGNKEYGGPGAYTSGEIELKKNTKLYVYVGEYPTYLAGSCLSSNPNNSFNGNIYGTCSGGGGATDIRLLNGEWNDNSSLRSRIMVAAGGGAEFYSIYGTAGAGGELKGLDGSGCDPEWTNFTPVAGTGGTQVATSFGIGPVGTSGGGGGYYAGNAGKAGNAGGGSSFISGYKGCIAVTSESDTTPICTEESDPNDQDISCSYHYSGYKFTDGLMIAGTKSMPTPDGRSTMTGNVGNGYARITLIEKKETYSIDYNLNGGTLDNKKKTYSTFDDPITLSQPTKVGYDFAGWVGGKNIIDESNYRESIEKDGITYTNNGDGSFSVSGTAEETVSIPLITLTDVMRDGVKYYLYSSFPYNGYTFNISIQLRKDGIKDWIYPGHPVIYEDGETAVLVFYIPKGYTVSAQNVRLMLTSEYDDTYYEAYDSTPQINRIIPKGSKGNRLYTAVWTPKYEISYDLDGGQLNNGTTVYSAISNNVTLATPTKTKYRFAGWTGGKNLFQNSEYNVNVEGTIKEELSDGVVKVTPVEHAASGVWFDIHTNTYKKYLTNKSVVISFELKADSNKTIRLCINRGEGICTFADLTTEWKRYYLVKDVMDYNDNHDFTIYNNYNHVDSSNLSPFYIRNAQIEIGTEMTAYEEPILTPTKNITIPTGSTGNRSYTANWEEYATVTVIYDACIEDRNNNRRYLNYLDTVNFIEYEYLPNLTTQEYLARNSDYYMFIGDVWGLTNRLTILNELFEAGANVVTTGNDTTAQSVPFGVTDYHSTEDETIVKKANNEFTNNFNQTYSTGTDGKHFFTTQNTEVWYTVTVDNVEYDYMGSYTGSKGNRWIWSSGIFFPENSMLPTILRYDKYNH